MIRFTRRGKHIDVGTRNRCQNDDWLRRVDHFVRPMVPARPHGWRIDADIKVRRGVVPLTCGKGGLTGFRFGSGVEVAGFLTDSLQNCLTPSHAQMPSSSNLSPLRAPAL